MDHTNSSPSHPVGLAGFVDVKVGHDLEILHDVRLHGLLVAGVPRLEQPGDDLELVLVVVVADQQRVVGALPQVHQHPDTGVRRLPSRQHLRKCHVFGLLHLSLYYDYKLHPSYTM